MFGFKRRPKFDCQEAVADIRKEMYQKEIEIEVTKLQQKAGDELIIYKPYNESSELFIYRPDKQGRWMVEGRQADRISGPLDVYGVRCFIDGLLFQKGLEDAKDNQKKVHKTSKQSNNNGKKYLSKNKGPRDPRADGFYKEDDDRW